MSFLGENISKWFLISPLASHLHGILQPLARSFAAYFLETIKQFFPAKMGCRSFRLLQLIRSYWSIENGLHYRWDVTFLEDRTCMTKGNMG